MIVDGYYAGNKGLISTEQNKEEDVLATWGESESISLPEIQQGLAFLCIIALFMLLGCDAVVLFCWLLALHLPLLVFCFSFFRCISNNC